jgi:hypothetical protein
MKLANGSTLILLAAPEQTKAGVDGDRRHETGTGRGTPRVRIDQVAGALDTEGTGPAGGIGSSCPGW